MTPIQKVIYKKNKQIKPVWLMRQAGRYLPEFRKIRKINTNFIDLCLNKTKVKYYHVDHKLRSQSSVEAKKLKSLLKNFDINCKILNWIGKKPKSNIQSVARTKRYNLFYKECLKDKINHIFIAHHLDDLYENFIIRLLRGSGLKGLVSFNQITTSYKGELKILRPLIVNKKIDLELISKKVFKFN